MADYASEYHDIRDRVSTLIRSHGDEVDELAPATPEWRVRDIVSHMAGICDDILCGNLEGVGTDAWTAGQVSKRREWPVERILAEWDEQGAAVEQIMNQFPDVTVGQMVYDATTHEHDIRGALAEPGARDSGAVAIAFEWGTDRFGEALGGEGTFTFVTDVGEKTVGTGDALAGIRTSRFELIRAFTGRRSLAQMRAYDWTGAPAPERLVLSDLFHMPEVDVLE